MIGAATTGTSGPPPGIIGPTPLAGPFTPVAPAGGILRVLTNSQIDQIEAQKQGVIDLLQRPQEQVIGSLASHVRKFWESAAQAKIPFENQMLENLRMVNGEYSPEKLKAIRDVGAPEIYMMLADTKCRSAEAWIKDILIQPGVKPWDIEATPEPDLPNEIREAIRQEFIAQTFSNMATAMAAAGQDFDPIAIAQAIQGLVPQFEAEMERLIAKRAKENTEKFKRRLDDHLTEGGWYRALDEFIYDIVVLKAGIIKGPVTRKERVKIPAIDPATGKHIVKVEEKIITKYERRSPFNIYPAKNSTGINDAPLIDKITLTPKELSDLIGVEGFSETEIRAVVEEYRQGGLREWTRIDSMLPGAQQNTTQATQEDRSETGNMDCLEYWGSAPGKLLRDWGMNPQEIPDETREFDVCAWLIGNHIIKAMLNPDPLGKKPFHKTSFKEKPGVFWGEGLPEIVEDLQGACNACARAIVHNVGIASGPQVEIDIGRLAPGESQKIWPWRVWLTNNEQMMNGPAINFYAPPIVTERLINAYVFFAKLADEYSGVPAYAHGDPQVGGAGNTASGFSMMATMAARGIKAVIKNIDNKVIAATIEAQFYRDIVDEENFGIIPDYKIVAKGSSSLIAKEQQAMRRTEFLKMTLNPIDLQIMGPDGRRCVLRDVAKALDMDVEKIFPENAEARFNPMIPAGGTPAGSQVLGPDGNPVVGQDFRTFNERAN